MHTLFDPHKKYIGIGEDHIGSFGFNFSDEKHINHLKDYLTNQDSTYINVWYEGPNVSAKSRSFKNFVNALQIYIRGNKKQFNEDYFIRERGWERDLTFPKSIEYASILLGPTTSDVIHLVGSNLDGEKTLLDAIVDCGKFRGTQSRGPTKQEAIDALSNRGAPSDVLQVMMTEKSATKDTVHQIYDGMRDKYFEGTRGAFKTSEIYKKVNSFNDLRDKHLAKKMMYSGGIFLAGDDHIRLCKKYL